MENIIWLSIMIPCSALLTGIGIFAYNRKKPMGFWSGAEVRAEEIWDIPAYNRANGRMWMGYSLLYWLAAWVGLQSGAAAGILIAIGCVVGIPALVVIYKRIYAKYKI